MCTFKSPIYWALHLTPDTTTAASSFTLNQKLYLLLTYLQALQRIDEQLDSVSCGARRVNDAVSRQCCHKHTHAVVLLSHWEALKLGLVQGRKCTTWSRISASETVILRQRLVSRRRWNFLFFLKLNNSYFYFCLKLEFCGSQVSCPRV